MNHSFDLPPLEALRAVLAAGASGSFSAAAAALDVTHGAISRRVAAVETWAGVTMFVRHGRGVRVTLEGQRLLARIEQALAFLDDGARFAQAQDELDRVRVSVVPSFARLWLIPRLRLLEGDPPDLRIELDVEQRLTTLSDSRIAIRHGRGGWPGVSAVPLFEETLVPVASAEIADRLGPDAAAGVLLRERLLVDLPDANWRAWFAAADIDYERRPDDRTFADYDMMLLAAAEGLGVALAREPFGQELCDLRGLVPVSGRRIPSPARFFVVSRLGARRAATDRLIERILEATAAPK